MSDPRGESKLCVVCGRTMTWRKKWARNWDAVRYCSDACRRRGKRGSDDALETAILELLTGRRRGASICPSEAARRVGGEQWQQQMEPARAAARRLVAQGKVDILAQGRIKDPSTARGPIRIRLRR